MLNRFRFGLGLLLGTALGGVAFILAVAGLRGTSMPATGWVRHSIETKRQLALRPTSPKLLLCGGSSVELGMSAREIESRFAVPVVNFGLIMPLGIEYLMHCATNALHPGDTVLLALEFDLYDWPSRWWDEPQYVVFLHSEDVAYLAQRPPKEQLILAMKLPPNWLPDTLGARLTGRALPPQSDFLNEWGDRTDNTRQARATIPPAVLRPSPILLRGLGDEPKGFSVVRQFCAWARSHSVMVLATFPNLAENPAYRQPAALATVRRIRAFFDEQAVPFLGSFEEALFPPEDCYDTAYHLYADAVTRRTERLAGLLRPFLPQRPLAPTNQFSNR